MKLLQFIFFTFLLIEHYNSFGQTSSEISQTDNLTNKVDTSATIADKIKCDSLNRIGLSFNNVKNQWSCISYKQSISDFEILRIEEKISFPDICDEVYIYYYRKKKLIKVIIKKGNENKTLVNSIFYYENDKPIYEIQHGIEFVGEYPIQRAYELLNYLTK